MSSDYASNTSYKLEFADNANSHDIVLERDQLKIFVDHESAPYLEGIDVGNNTPLIYCHNDLGGAWERDQLGSWVYPCTPGGEEQRRAAFHVGINVVLYAMTGNYKEDLIHAPFIRKRLQR